jgi:hypothetical protein
MCCGYGVYFVGVLAFNIILKYSASISHIYNAKCSSTTMRQQFSLQLVYLMMTSWAETCNALNK